MIKNNIKIAWRSLKKQPLYTLLNVAGLAIGLAGSLLIALYVHDELSYDAMWKDADRIHRVNVDVKFGGSAEQFCEASAPMAQAMMKDFPQVEEVTRFRNQGSYLVKKGAGDTQVKEEAGTYVDASFFQMFGVDLLAGNPMTALQMPRTIVLTRSAAEKHFPVEEAVGKTLILDDDAVYEIVGVVEDFPENSFLRNHSVLVSMEGYRDSKMDQWGNHNYNTFFKLATGTSEESFQESLQSMFERYLMPWAQQFYPGLTIESFEASGNYARYSSIPLTNIHLYSNRTGEMSVNGSMQNVYIFSFIAFFLLILASVNFMNLATAQSLKRAKEVGIRKTLGSSRWGLVNQFLTEASLTTLCSLILAIGLAYFSLPYFNDLADKEITIPLGNPLFVVGILVGAIVLGVLSGLYPAFFMSRFKPVRVLKGGKSSQSGSSGVRNALVIFQFGISICLIVCTLVVYKQLKFIQNKELGYSKEQVLLVEDAYGVGEQLSSLKQEIVGLSAVEEVSLSTYIPTASYRSSSSFFLEGSRDQEDALNMQRWPVDHDYITALGMKLVAGRNFSREYGSDSSAIIINESAVEILGMSPEEVLGKRLGEDFSTDDEGYRNIIGVVENFHFESLKEEVGALSLVLGNSSSYIVAKVNTADISQTLAAIETLWNEKAAGLPFNFSFLDEAYDEFYESEQRLGRIFVIFTVLSIFIACLGLFGLAALNTEKRRKEIGIRKVLGASISQIFMQLTIDFLKLVFIAIVVALPIAYLIMNKWLQDFSYKIEVGWGILILTAILAVIISVVTVGYQSIKAAVANPVKSLRTE